MTIKKVTLIGLGAMGAFFAPGLDAYLGKENFRVLADGARKERIEKNGFVVNGVKYNFSVITPNLQGDPADLIIIAVKDTGLSQAIEDIKNQLGPNTQIMCVMNGVDSEERIAAVYGWERIIYSYMRVSGSVKDGAATVSTKVGKVFFGEKENDVLSLRVQAIKDLFDAAGIGYRIDKDMIKGIWNKFMCNISENMTCALLGVPYKAFHVSEHANAIRLAAMREVIAIANRLGIGLNEEDIRRQEEIVQKRLLPHNKPSTLQDLENGRITEVDMFAGKVVRLGKELGVDTPVNWMFYHGIKVLEEKNEGDFRID